MEAKTKDHLLKVDLVKKSKYHSRPSSQHGESYIRKFSKLSEATVVFINSIDSYTILAFDEKNYHSIVMTWENCSLGYFLLFSLEFDGLL